MLQSEQLLLLELSCHVSSMVQILTAPTALLKMLTDVPVLVMEQPGAGMELGEMEWKRGREEREWGSHS